MIDKKEKIYANVHSVESFGTVDGPGIRFVLFLQGCHLQCKYCQNRDTWSQHIVNKRSVDDVFNQIVKYESYIKPKGGVTISGGEPLLQSKFLINLFKKLKKENIHTAIDTSGMFPINDEIKELLSVTDLVLLDIKHIDDEKCKDLVGMSNKLELEFARYLSGNNIPVWIRQVLVPGYTDDEKDLIKLKDFISSLSNVERIEILPYHDLGKTKWEQLHIKYPLEGVREATSKDVIKAKKILGL